MTGDPSQATAELASWAFAKAYRAARESDSETMSILDDTVAHFHDNGESERDQAVIYAARDLERLGRELRSRPAIREGIDRMRRRDGIGPRTIGLG